MEKFCSFSKGSKPLAKKMRSSLGQWRQSRLTDEDSRVMARSFRKKPGLTKLKSKRTDTETALGGAPRWDLPSAAARRSSVLSTAEIATSATRNISL